MDTTSLSFPYKVNDLAQTATTSGDENIRAKIVQVVLTSPGERVNLPDFGCGLRDLVFDPNNDILAATTEFAISKALQQWLSDDIIVQSVDVSNSNTDPRIAEGELQIEVVYLRRDRLVPAKLKIAF
ncbi:MAG TPA: GPW/gp25 family protein [Candidatus Angelobacter sp.]|nr:GPW/gp25 family protein [Candidatus Angelobacter sp.]